MSTSLFNEYKEMKKKISQQKFITGSTHATKQKKNINKKKT